MRGHIFEGRSKLAHPCLSLGPTPYELGDHIFQFEGSGNFNECVAAVRAILGPHMKANVHSNCIKAKGAFPKTIIGIDNFGLVMDTIGIALGEAVSPEEIAEKGREVCQMTWKDIIKRRSEIGPGSEPIASYRAWRACFGSSFIYSLLTDIYGINPLEKAFIPLLSFNSYELSWAVGAAAMAAGQVHIAHLSHTCPRY